MSQHLWNAIVLGGGDPGDPFAAAHGVNVKPLIPIAGKPMGQWVLEALRESGRIDKVAYVGPLAAGMEALVDIRVTDRGTLLANLEAGVAALRESGVQPRILVVTADIPMLKASDLTDLLDNAPDAPLIYPIVRREDCEAAYPEVKRTYARLSDGVFTGGNLFLLDPALLGQFMPRLKAMLAARKKPLRLAAMIGPGVLLRLLTRRLSIHDLEQKVSTLLDVPARAYISTHPAIGTDVDKESDLALAQHELQGRKP